MKIIGHRGAKGLAPENTLAGLETAIACHADEVELDVRVTSDGHVVLIHDKAIPGPDGVMLAVADHSLRELLAIRPDLPTLEQAIELVNQRVPMLIEVKRGTVATPVAHSIGKYLAKGWKTTDFEFLSFDYSILRTLTRLLPEVPLVVNESWSGVRARFRARRLHTMRLNMNARWLWTGFLAPMRQRGYLIAPYTLNDPAKARRWQRYIYGVITDYPDRFTP